jgi:RimJ/RimL family protein N-acetyltransferase
MSGMPPADPSPTPVLRTERLLLRGWTDADRDPFAALNADPVVGEMLAGTLTREQSDAFVDRIVERWRSEGYSLWAVERLEDGAFLGTVGLSIPSFAPERTVEVGWRLAYHAWGRGYATEAARAVVACAFDQLELDEIVALTTSANVRSRRVMERLGMTHDPADDFEHPLVPPGHPIRPHVLYRLRRD